MEPAEDAARGAAVVVLDETGVNSGLFERLAGPAFDEEAALIAVDDRLDNHWSGEIGGDEAHQLEARAGWIGSRPAFNWSIR